MGQPSRRIAVAEVPFIPGKRHLSGNRTILLNTILAMSVALRVPFFSWQGSMSQNNFIIGRNSIAESFTRHREAMIGSFLLCFFLCS